jgi:hypothetical protein
MWEGSENEVSILLIFQLNEFCFSPQGGNETPPNQESPLSHKTTDRVEIKLGYVMASLLLLQTICQILFNK